ncbi:MAG TPA: OmpA family protein [Cyclobacteriaceae bacterium]|nr:OmpA family protein [Cyclobacteriaceae bacterium]
MKTRLFFCVLGMVWGSGSLHCFGQTDQKLGGAQINQASNIETAVVAEPLDGRVNSAFIEYGPTLTKDGKRLYFSRQGHPKNTGGAKDEDIWYCEFIDSTQNWTEAKRMDPPLNNLGPNFICGVGVNGDTILLGNEYLKNGKMKAGLSLSIRNGQSWSFPQPINIENNYNLSERTSFDISNDRKALIISQKKTDSQGELDLYVTFRKPNPKNPYSAAESINMGPVINTFGDETSPFLAYDNRTLYFSSNGHNGYGKQDIFVSHRLDETWTNWSRPENLGPGINTAYDDTFFGFTPRSRYAYYSRGITPENLDIYRLDMTYLFKPSAKPLNQMDSLINVAQIGQSLVLDSIFKDNSADIRPEAVKKLKLIANYMNAYKGYTIMVSTHSNWHATRKESQVLSDRRAAKVIEFLVDEGISNAQVEPLGYGHDIVANMDNLPTLPRMKSRIANSVEFRLVGYTKYVKAEFR